MAVSRLALERHWDLYLLNRGRRNVGLDGAHTILGDITDPDKIATAIRDQHFDVVVNWIAFKPEDVERDIALFAGKTRQYIFISSASAYQKPPSYHVITESTPLANPYWNYSQDKIACELRLLEEYRRTGFPVTVVRPSHTYNTIIPVALGDGYTVVDRLKRGQPVVVHGDGTSLWTLTHAEDFAKGFVGLMGHQLAPGHAFHITSDEVLTWNQIYEAVADAAGVKAQLVHVSSEFIANVADEIGIPTVRGSLLGDKMYSAIFDNSKIKAFVPEYRATIPLAQGIRKTLKWFDGDPSRQKIIPKNNELLDAIIARQRRD